MKRFILIITPLLIYLSVDAQLNYSPLDADNPIGFHGDFIIFEGEKISLGPHAFFIDGQLSNQEASKYDYVFNLVNEAAQHLTDGTEEEPMVLYIAPWVYWIDNPDDPEVRVPKLGSVPFGLEIACEWLRFCGLTDDPSKVILAGNRGQTMGAKGNFTLLNIKGDGLSSENITFGNYCNINLVYPLNPELNREKRGSAIVQAQLVFSDGDKVVARNTNFISRLNLAPFWGSKRTLFDRCHFESTDDALNGSAVYLNCTFDFYSGKPFYWTTETGAVFLNCDITSFTRGNQYFTKAGGQLAVADIRFHSETLSSIGWRDQPAQEARNYQHNVSLNGKPILISAQHTYPTVDMTGNPVLDAYRFALNNEVIYNTYNLLRGDDDWDPMGIKNLVLAAEKEDGKAYSNLATQLLISPSQDTLETGKETLVLNATVNKFGNYELKGETVNWAIAHEYESLVDLKIREDGSCEVIPTNQHDDTKEVIITASTSTGLESASVVYVAPAFLDAPKFTALPRIVKRKEGKLSVDYKLDMRFPDQSLVTWYRCTDANGSNPIEIAVSRFNEPKLEYALSKGDLGYYIMATVEPNHLRCNPGKPVPAITSQAISAMDVKGHGQSWNVDLASMSTAYQTRTKAGFWTLDCYKPADTQGHEWAVDSINDPWCYGVGVFGASKDTGLVQASKGARLRYTPVGEKFGDMKISFTAVPAKTAGQGFSSAKAQYMDVWIKLDTKTLNGYALRLVRTTKYHDAIDFILMQYVDGNAVPISEPVSASCYRPDCYLTVEVKGNRLMVHAETRADYYIDPNQHEVVREVNMETEITPNQFGGFGFQHTGSVGSGATLIKELKIEWN